MTVHLTSETERLLTEWMRGGTFTDANQAIFAALSGVSLPPVDDELLDLLDEAEEDVANGRVHRWEDVRQRVLDAFSNG